MAAAESPPPPPPPPLAPTTITALGDDILREILLRLPDITSLTRAAFTCPAFLHAVRSSAEFRRRFRQLRAPPLLALFLWGMRAIVPAAAGKRSDIAAEAFDDLLQNDSNSESEWPSEPDFSYEEGYANFISRRYDQDACYNPHSQALIIYPKNDTFDDIANGTLLEFHTLSEDGEEKRPSRVVCVHRDRKWTWARVAVFSSQTMEWQVVLPEVDTGGLRVDYQYDQSAPGTVVNGFVYWVHKGKGCILALNTATFQFSRMELPPHLNDPFSMFQLGHTKDGQFCVVSVLLCSLYVWLWVADSDGVEKFMPHKISLWTNVSRITELSQQADVGMRPMAVINGFVYLSVYRRHPQHPYSGDPQYPEWILSFCLETDEMNLLHKESQLLPSMVDPYIMVSWPSSLIMARRIQVPELQETCLKMMVLLAQKKLLLSFSPRCNHSKKK